MNDSDRLDLAIGAMSLEDFRALLAGAANVEDRRELLRRRFRWRVDEYAEHVVRPMIERHVKWWPLIPFHHDLLRSRPRFRDRKGTGLELILGPRGIAKSTSAKIGMLHGIHYGIDPGYMVFGKNDGEAVAWTSVLGAWFRNPSPLWRKLWPDTGVSGDQNNLVFRVGAETMTLHARGWNAGGRGTAATTTARPTHIVLDDIETEDNSRTEQARDILQGKLSSAAINIMPTEGGGTVRWLQTPIPSGVAVRAQRREAAMAAWDVRSHPAVRAWPPRTDLWEQCRAIYFDADAHETRDDRRSAALEFYEANKAAMDENADVLDPYRLPIFACYVKLWDIGPAAFATEFQMDTRTGRAGRIFDSSRFARHRVIGGAVVSAGGKSLPLAGLRKAGHWDPSDGGGDDGAIVIGAGERNGRTMILEIIATQARTSEQIRALVSAAKRHGLTSFQYEGNQLSSLLWDALQAECRAQGWPLTLVPKHTSENKEDRLAGMEPATSAGLISFPDDADPKHLREFDDFDARRTNNRDNVMDAVHRVHEMLHEPPVPRALRRGLGVAV